MTHAEFVEEAELLGATKVRSYWRRNNSALSIRPAKVTVANFTLKGLPTVRLEVFFVQGKISCGIGTIDWRQERIWSVESFREVLKMMEKVDLLIRRVRGED